jgi:hypothetical protein
MCFKHKNNTLNEKDLKNIVKLKKISTIKDFRFGTFPSISGSGSGYTFYRYLCSLAYCGVQNILCCVFVLFVFVLCTQCCQFLLMPFSIALFPPNVYLKDIRKTTRIYSAWPKVSHQNGRRK